MVAHELGHVWIFTHHPYLQTEAGANQIAERLVARQTLERVYAKVWPEGAPRGGCRALRRRALVTGISRACGFQEYKTPGFRDFRD